MKTFVCVLMILFAPVAAHAAENSQALVRAMRSDEIAVASVKRAFLSGALEEKFGKTSAGCVKKVPWTEFTAGSVRVVESVLTASEIATALTFYQSPAGGQFVAGMVRRLRASQGPDSTLPPVAGKEEIPPEQMAAISDFTSSDLGRKILGREMTESPAALALGKDIMSSIAARCGSR
jgi:hypothetical protein